MEEDSWRGSIGFRQTPMESAFQGFCVVGSGYISVSNLSHNPALSKLIEYFTPQTFSLELCLGNFDITALPWTARLNVERFNTLFL